MRIIRLAGAIAPAGILAALAFAIFSGATFDKESLEAQASALIGGEFPIGIDLENKCKTKTQCTDYYNSNNPCAKGNYYQQNPCPTGKQLCITGNCAVRTNKFCVGVAEPCPTTGMSNNCGTANAGQCDIGGQPVSSGWHHCIATSCKGLGTTIDCNALTCG